jgi:hypothetical protein
VALVAVWHTCGMEWMQAACLHPLSLASYIGHCLFSIVHFVAT